MDDKQLSFGEQAVGLNFNPSDNEKVDAIKKLYAQIIDILAPEGLNASTTDLGGRLYGRAVNDAIGAQMWAVKAITFDA